MIDVSEWLHGFVLPLVAGGDVRVRGAIDAVELKALLEAGLDGDPAGEQVAEARQQVAAELILDAQPPLLDEPSLRLAAAVQNLLFLAHPGARGVSVTGSRRRGVAHYAAHLATLPEPRDAAELVARHTIVHHLFDLGRDDVRVSFWAGRREYRGAEPPSRLLKWPHLRRVREERWRIGVVAEAVADPFEREVVTALIAASPLTDLLEPTRLEPRFDLRSSARWLHDPEVARAVADRWLQLGFEQVGAPFVAALLELYGQKGAQKESKLATRFLCHLHLLWLLSEMSASEAARRIRMDTLASQKEPLRDFFGLFAAAQRLGLGRPEDLQRDEKWRAQVDGLARLCASICGLARVNELEGLMARGVGEMALAS